MSEDIEEWEMGRVAEGENSSVPRLKRHTELIVFQKAFLSAMQVFEMSKGFPLEERYSLTDQIRRSSRSVCANLAEAWRKRRYKAAFISKLSDAEAEAAESQVWLQFSTKCGYTTREAAAPLYRSYDEVIAILVDMINHPDAWTLK